MEVNKRFYFFLVCELLLFYIWIISKDQLFLGLWISLLFVIVTSFLIAQTSLSGIEFSRSSKTGRQHVFSIFEEKFEIINKSKIPKIWIEISDSSFLGKNINSRVIANLKPNSSKQFQSSMLLLKRGVFLLGPTVLRSGDPLGLFTSRKFIDAKKNIIVYPELIYLDKFPIHPSSELGGEHFRTYTTHTTPTAAGIREYLPGDPLNRVHWPYSLKQQKLMVKEFDEDTQSNAWIILDARSDKHYRSVSERYSRRYRFFSYKKKISTVSQNRDSFELAVTIAASLVNYYINNNFAVGLASVGSNIVSIEPEKGFVHLNKVFEKLAMVNDDGDHPISSVLDELMIIIPERSSVILITAEEFSEIESTIYAAAMKNIDLLPIWINADSFNEQDADNKILQRPKGISLFTIINYRDDIRKKLARS